MYLFTKKTIYISIIDYIYLQFIDYIFTLFFAIIAYSIFSKEDLMNFNPYLFSIIYISIFGLFVYVCYLILGKKIYSLIHFILNKYSQNIFQFLGYSFLILVWIGMFVSLSNGYNLYFNSTQDKTILFFVFISVLILIVSIFSVLFILDQKKTLYSLSDKTSRDSLTGVYSNLYGNELLKMLTTNSNKNFTLAYIDIDNLKRVNDDLGHNAGNLYICYIINSIKYQLNQEDQIIRHGGDEFLIVSQNKSEIDLEQTLSSILLNLNEHAPESLRNFNVSFSYGVSEYHINSNQTLSDLLEITDKKMYEQKRNKQNLLKQVSTIK